MSLPPLLATPLGLLAGLLPVLLLVVAIVVSSLVSLLPGDRLRKHVLRLLPQLTRSIEAVRGNAGRAP